jgi:hypothetical protein
MRGIERRYHTLATDGDTSRAFGVCVLTLFVALSNVTSRHYSASLRKCRAWSAREQLDAVFAVTVWTALRRWWRQQLCECLGRR